MQIVRQRRKEERKETPGPSLDTGHASKVCSHKQTLALRWALRTYIQSQRFDRVDECCVLLDVDVDNCSQAITMNAIRD